jgi:hypothetical protein
MNGDVSHKLPGVPAVGLFYGRDLAYVHDAFGYLARGGARTLLRLLSGADIRDGLVVDLGAGSGITARVLTGAGHQVLGVELPRTWSGSPGNGRPRPGSSARRCWTPSWRRSDELHMLRLYPRQEGLDDLASAGFQTRVLAGYGSAVRFRRGHAGILAVKPSKGTS